MRYKAYLVSEMHGALLGAEPRVQNSKDVSPGSYIDEDDDLQRLQNRLKEKNDGNWPYHYRFSDTYFEEKFRQQVEEWKKENTKILKEYLEKNKSELVYGNPDIEMIHRRVQQMLACHPFFQGTNLQMTDIDVEYGMYSVFITIKNSGLDQIILRNCFPN